MNYYGSYPMLNYAVATSVRTSTKLGAISVLSHLHPASALLHTFFRYSLNKQGNFRRYFNFLPVHTNANTKADTNENARKYKCKYKLTILPVNTHVNTGKSRGKPLGKSLGKPLDRSLSNHLADPSKRVTMGFRRVPRHLVPW